MCQTNKMTDLDEFTNPLSSYISIPTRAQVRYNNDKSWFTEELECLRREKDEAHQRGGKDQNRQTNCCTGTVDDLITFCCRFTSTLTSTPPSHTHPFSDLLSFSILRYHLTPTSSPNLWSRQSHPTTTANNRGLVCNQKTHKPRGLDRVPPYCSSTHWHIQPVPAILWPWKSSRESNHLLDLYQLTIFVNVNSL